MLNRIDETGHFGETRYDFPHVINASETYDTNEVFIIFLLSMLAWDNNWKWKRPDIYILTEPVFFVYGNIPDNCWKKQENHRHTIVCL